MFHGYGKINTRSTGYLTPVYQCGKRIRELHELPGAKSSGKRILRLNFFLHSSKY
jgi:hypothetical protein